MDAAPVSATEAAPDVVEGGLIECVCPLPEPTELEVSVPSYASSYQIPVPELPNPLALKVCVCAGISAIVNECDPLVKEAISTLCV